jgi:hypothetical protein
MHFPKGSESVNIWTTTIPLATDAKVAAVATVVALLALPPDPLGIAVPTLVMKESQLLMARNDILRDQ